MDLAIDTNILLACFKPNSITRRIILIESLHLFTTEFQFVEVDEYMKEVSSKYKLSEEMIKENLLFLQSRVETVAKEEYGEFIKKIKGKIPDIDDVPLLALAFAKGMPVWSNDPHFKQQTILQSLTTSELIQIIKNGMK